MDYFEIANQISWSDPSEMVSKYFSVYELIFLPKLGRLATNEEMSPTICANLVKYAQSMDVVREFLGVPIDMHDCLRPLKYNVIVKGKTQSMHLCGLAGDWSAEGMSCDEVRGKILPMLPVWKMRCENNGKGAPWIHTDLKKVPVGGSYYFIP